MDDEGDKVLLATDSDLVAAVNFARISGWKVSLMFYNLQSTSVGCVCAYVIKVFGMYPEWCWLFYTRNNVSNFCTNYQVNVTIASNMFTCSHMP